MDSKRKANGTAAADPDDRSSKRRKLTTDFDLSKGESRESTTVYGLSFLEQIRRTADKSGRPVATYFEKLLPREENKDYYKRTRMPIALETIEEKLNNGDFTTLAEVESYFKRMITNAKEFYPRSSTIYDDAERVRKALSNYMTKKNPAYKTSGYQALPTPLPPEEEEEEEAEEEEAEAEAEAEEGEEADEAEEEPEEEEPAATEEEAKAAEKGAQEEEGDDGAEQDADGEDEEQGGSKSQTDAADGEEQAKGTSRSSRRRSIVLKRRESGRLSKNSTAQAQASPRPSATPSRPTPSRPTPSRPTPSRPTPSRAPPSRPDHQYEGVPYKGLSFQQAQEKVIEELLRYNEPEYEGYFEPFHNLPPRSLKDYYRVVADPTSLKKLQKMAKGVRGRNDVTGVSDFKSWAAFEEKCKLLWANAYFYNEEGSEIFELAQELEKAFYEQLAKAQAVVPEPSQPKIKLKVGQAQEASGSSKKITIHVGGRGGSTDSPAPNTAPQSADSPAADANGSTRNAARLEAARSVSLSAPSPSPSVQPGLKTEDGARVMSPAVAAPAPGGTPGPVRPAAAAILPQPAESAPLANGHAEPRRFRRPGKGIADALISRLRVRLHPNMQADNGHVLTMLPHARELHQSATVSLAPHHNRVFVLLQLPDQLFHRQYSLWVLVDKQPLKPCMHPLPGQLPQERAFELVLHPGVNVIEAHLIAAVPRSERQPGEPEVELEVLTVFANLMRP